MKRPLFCLLLASFLVLSCDDGGGDAALDLLEAGDSSQGETSPVCEDLGNSAAVAEPVFVRNISGQTSWFAAPLFYDLDHDGDNEIIAAYYELYVYDHNGELLATGSEGEGRVYAPHVVADLEGDGIEDIVVGRGSEVIAYEWREGALLLKEGWPASTETANNPPEVRGMSAADLNGDGLIEIAVTTTQTASTESGGAQVFVFNYAGQPYQPAGGHDPAWPRYNNLTGEGNDADRNGQGHSGYGCYGLNVGIANIDDDPELEVFATYDNHHIQAFDHDGVAIDAAPWFSNRSSDYSGERLTWGQFIRWTDPAVEEDHYHLHEGEWPHPSWTEWLQWTASPPSFGDLNGDGHLEVIGAPNIEMNEPYETQAYGLFVLEGSWGDGSRSAMRLAGWETLPRGDRPIEVEGWYPPGGVPAVVVVNIQGDEAPELIASLNDGYLSAYDAQAQRLWRSDITHGQAIMYASEPTVADLNGDGRPEILVNTFGDPEQAAGYLMIFAANGQLLHDIALPNPGENGNGNGAPAAPTVGDLDGDGQLEIAVQTFDHGMDIFTIPGSSESCILWGTARGGPLRMGQPNG